MTIEKLACKACGSLAMVPMDVTVEDHDVDTYEASESHFYSCHVCGDNWLSVKHEEESGDCKITFIHQMGVKPVLKRIAYMQTRIVLNETAVDEWEYYVDEDAIAEDEWKDQLKDRRDILLSICSN